MKRNSAHAWRWETASNVRVSCLTWKIHINIRLTAFAPLFMIILSETRSEHLCATYTLCWNTDVQWFKGKSQALYDSSSFTFSWNEIKHTVLSKSENSTVLRSSSLLLIRNLLCAPTLGKEKGCDKQKSPGCIILSKDNSLQQCWCKIEKWPMCCWTSKLKNSFQLLVKQAKSALNLHVSVPDPVRNCHLFFQGVKLLLNSLLASRFTVAYRYSVSSSH